MDLVKYPVCLSNEGLNLKSAYAYGIIHDLKK